MPWTASELEKKTGIRERRFSFDYDDATGHPLFPAGYGEPPGPAGVLAEQALREALVTADIDADSLDALIVGGSTPDRLHFGDDAQHLHHRLGMRPDAIVLQTNIGCAGAIFCLQWAKEMILSGARKRVAVVMVQVVSSLLNPATYGGSIEYAGKDTEAFLTALLFGDGAGAIVLEATGDDSDSAMVAVSTTNEHFEIAVQPGGGNLRPAGLPTTSFADLAVHIIGKRVADAYVPVMKKSIDAVLGDAGLEAADLARLYPHQANRRLIEPLREALDLPEERTAINVDRYGNTSGASVLILLAEDLRHGVVSLGSGAPVVLAAVGANLQYGAHLIRL